MDDNLRHIYNYLPLSAHIATAGQPLAEEIPLIANAGFDVVINLAMEDMDYSLDDERGLVTSLGMMYEHLPVVWETPTIENLQDFFLLMEKHQDKKLFVHCAMNMRVSCFMMLYRVSKLGWDYSEAMQPVREIWLPDEVWSEFIENSLRHSGL